MRRREYEKRLLLQRIESQRRMARLDWIELRDAVHPWVLLARGVSAVRPFIGPLRGAARAVGGSDRSERRGWRRIVLFAVAALPVAALLLERRR